MARLARLPPLPISTPSKAGPAAPTTWAMAKNTASASALISIGKISLTVR